MKLQAVNWPVVEGPSVYFVKLEMQNASGKLISDNFYWFAKNQRDLQHLNDIAPVTVHAVAHTAIENNARITLVELSNPTDCIALLTHLTLRDAETNNRILPVYYSDNYICLLPGEIRQVGIESEGRLVKEASLSVDGYNVTEQNISCR